LTERAPTGAFVSRYDEVELTTDSLLSAPSVYRKLLDTEAAPNPLWTETETDDPLALPLPSRDRPREFWPTAILASVIALIAILGVTRLFGASDEEPVEVLGITAQGSTIPTTVTTLPATTTTPVPTTTTTVAPTTTTLPPLTVIPVGAPIPLSELRLGAYGLDPFDFGEDYQTVLGRLGASLDEASEVGRPGLSNGEFGTCAGSLIQTVRWGRLLVIGVEDAAGVMGFVGYRLDATYDTFRYPAVRTRSGIGVGDSIGALESAYSRVTYLNDESVGLVFQVRDGNGQLLIWGPVTSNDAAGEIVGIYSPNSCTS
jgi:hypothetical protein